MYWYFRDRWGGKSEDHFELFATVPWPLLKLAGTGYKVETQMRDDYLFQIAGRTSFAMLEQVTGESLRDLGFRRFRDCKIEGTSVEVARIGMSGNLAYELHGPTCARATERPSRSAGTTCAGGRRPMPIMS